METYLRLSTVTLSLIFCFNLFGADTSDSPKRSPLDDLEGIYFAKVSNKYSNMDHVPAILYITEIKMPWN